MTTKVTFKLPSEFVANASGGVLLGEFNNWNYEEGVRLKKEEDGSMFAEIALIAGKSYQYRYLLNDGRWVNDYNTTTWSDAFGNAVENCIVNVPVPDIKKTSKASIAKAAAPKAAAPKEVVAPKPVVPKATTAKAKAPKAVVTPKAAAKAIAPKSAVAPKAAAAKKK